MQVHANRLGALAAVMGLLFVVAPMVLGPWWPLAPAVVFVAGYFYAMHCGFSRMVARAQDEAQLQRAESVLLALDDQPEPLPPELPVEFRDPAFQRHLATKSERPRDKVVRSCAICGQFSGRKAFCSQECQVQAYVGVQRLPSVPPPLIAERRFTALTHCPRGHVGLHYVTDGGPRYVERTCRFEACARKWLEGR